MLGPRTIVPSRHPLLRGPAASRPLTMARCSAQRRIVKKRLAPAGPVAAVSQNRSAVAPSFARPRSQTALRRTLKQYACPRSDACRTAQTFSSENSRLADQLGRARPAFGISQAGCNRSGASALCRFERRCPSLEQRGVQLRSCMRWAEKLHALVDHGQQAKGDHGCDDERKDERPNCPPTLTPCLTAQPLSRDRDIGIRGPRRIRPGFLWYHVPRLLRGRIRTAHGTARHERHGTICSRVPDA